MNKIKIYLLLSVFTLVFGSCANVSAPTGGPKDRKPPVILKQIPETGAVNFNEKKIRIWFDEYVNVRDLNSQFISSPPLKKIPKFVLKGKSVEFIISDTLKENTTYHFNFGNSIVDLNEANPYHNFNIAFSTGSEIDSMQIKGQLIDAFDLKPVENVLLLLYDNKTFYDSIPYKEIPNYIARTDKKGNFEITYIKYGEYKIFAIEDLNKNRIFDMPNERIAFLDSVIIPTVETEFKTDSLQNDSIKPNTIYTYKPDSLMLYLFEEENYQQYIKDLKREQADILKIIMNDSLSNKTKIKGLNFSIDDCYTEFSANKDSVLIFIQDTNIVKKDTLFVEFTYQMLDSMFALADFTDTLKFIYKEKEKKHIKKRRRDIVEEKTDKKKLINLKFNVKNNARKDLNTPVSFELSYPVISVDKSKFKVEYMPDTTYLPVDFDLIQDSVNKRKFYFKFPYEEITNYLITIDTNAFKNSFGLTNDTIQHRFVTQEISSYGKILLDLSNVKTPVIVQAFLKDKMIREKFVNNNGIVEFDYLHPGDYTLKLIYDKNGNHKWDTGKYLENLQPEKVIFYDKNIQIKANWDLEVKWQID